MTPVDGGEGLQTVADSVEMLFDSVGQFRNEVKRTWTAAVTNGDGLDETETRAGSTRSDTNLRLRL